MTITWTVESPDTLDALVVEASKKLGYMNKSELIREAVRVFLLEREIFLTVGNLDNITPSKEAPADSLAFLRQWNFTPEELSGAIEEGREQLEALVKDASRLDKT